MHIVRCFYRIRPVPALTIVGWLFFFGMHRDAMAQEASILKIELPDSARINSQIREARRFIRSGYWDSAQVSYEQVLEQSRLINYYDGIIMALAGVGNSIASRGKLQESLKWYHMGLGVYWRHSGSPASVQSVFGGMGWRQIELGRFDSAYFYFRRGLREAEQHPVKDNAVISGFYNFLSIYWSKMGETGRGLLYIEKAIDRAQQIPDTVVMDELLLSAYVNKAGIYHTQLKERDSAFHYLQLAAARSDGMSLKASSLYYNMGCLLYEDEDYQGALSMFERSYGISKRLNDYSGRFTAEQKIGAAYFKLKDYQSAEMFLLEAVRGYKNDKLKGSFLADYLLVFYTLGQLNAQLGRFEQAFGYMAEAYYLKDTLYKDLHRRDVLQFEYKYQTFEKDMEISGKQLEIQRQQSMLKEKNLLIGGMLLSGILLTALFLSVWRSYKNRKQMQDKHILILQKEIQMDQLRSMINGEEQERARLARELHDGIGGMLAAIKMNVSTYQDKHRVQNDQELNEVIDLVESTANEVRKSAHNLMPDILLKHNLPEALRIFCDSINKGGSVQVDIQFHTDWHAPDKIFELSVYRILQELIQNTVKHASASMMIIQFRTEDGRLHITVEDDGKGYDPAATREGLGLHNIRSRLNLLRGDFSIESREGRGTSVFVEFDLNLYKENKES